MLRILVIEPDDAIAETITDALTATSHVVRVATAAEALAECDHDGAPDISIVDLELPDIPALTLAVALHHHSGGPRPLFWVSRRPRLTPRFAALPVLQAPFDATAVRIVLQETLFEWGLRPVHH